MQVRHAKRGDEANLAFLLEDHERHYGNAVPDSAGAAGAAFLVDPPPNATLCLVADGDDGLVGFAILQPHVPAPKLTHRLLPQGTLTSPNGRDRPASARS